VYGRNITFDSTAQHSTHILTHASHITQGLAKYLVMQCLDDPTSSDNISIIVVGFPGATQNSAPVIDSATSADSAAVVVDAQSSETAATDATTTPSE
jgi:hypothetical protein